MNAIESTRLKTSKSRIPVPVKNKKSVNENNSAGAFSKLASSKNCNPQLLKLDKVTNVKFKAQSSVRTNIKSSCIKEKELSLRTVKSFDNKEKNLSLKCKPKLDVKKGKGLPSSKSNPKCFDNEEEKQSTLKTSSNSASDSVKKLPVPKIISEKENDPPVIDHFAAQKDIKFEANEIYRNMILREKEISPSACNLLPGIRFSSILSQRPSIYQKFEISRDPFKEAMEAIQNVSAKRESKYKPGRQFITPISPFKDRGSFYTPCADPKKEVMESLQKLKLKQLQKSASRSTKKVTFDLNIKECTPINACDSELKSFKNAENRLTQINEKSEENTPNSPQNVKVKTSSSKEDDKNLSQSGSYQNDKDFLSQQEIKAAATTDSTSSDMNSEKISSSECEKLVFNSLKENHPVKKTSDLPGLRIMDKTSIQYQRTEYTECQILELKNLNEVKSTQAKVYTPRPVSFYSQCKVMNSSSPEFSEKGGSEALLKFAPICTPLVLKSVAKSTELSPDIALSPVRLKLDFSEKETPRNKTPKKPTVFNLGNIVTHKNKLDELADEECLWLLNESIPVICRRYLTNPVAVTLTEGDEMHFIPIQF